MKKTHIAFALVVLVVLILSCIFIPPFLRFKSYERFIMVVLKVKNFKTDSFITEPFQPIFPPAYVTDATDPAKIIKQINKKGEVAITKSDQLGTLNILPISSFGYINAREYFIKNYFVYPLTVNGIEGFPEEFYIRFYDPSDHILTLVVLQYAPDIKSNLFLFGFGSPFEIGIDGIPDVPQNKTFKNDILRYLGENKIDKDESLTIYTGKGFLASIFYLTPKTNSNEDNESIASAHRKFDQDLLKTLYGN